MNSSTCLPKMLCYPLAHFLVSIMKTLADIALHPMTRVQLHFLKSAKVMLLCLCLRLLYQPIIKNMCIDSQICIKKPRQQASNLSYLNCTSVCINKYFLEDPTLQSIISKFKFQLSVLVRNGKHCLRWNNFQINLSFFG